MRFLIQIQIIVYTNVVDEIDTYALGDMNPSPYSIKGVYVQARAV